MRLGSCDEWVIRRSEQHKYILTRKENKQRGSSPKDTKKPNNSSSKSKKKQDNKQGKHCQSRFRRKKEYNTTTDKSKEWE